METTFKKFKYLGIGTTPAEEHVHCTRVKEGETYLISKTNQKDFVSITGNLYNRDFGVDRVIDKHIHISRVKEYCKLIKTCTCRVSYDDYDWRNKILIMVMIGDFSPKSIRLTAFWGENVTTECKALFSKWNGYWSEAKFGSGEQHFEEEISEDLLKEMLNLSK